MRLSSLTLLAVLVAAGCRNNGSGSGDDETDDGGTSGGPSTVSETTPTDSGEEEGEGTTEGDDDDSGSSDTGDPPPPLPTSPKANVRFKGPRRFANDLAQALELPVEDMCLELGDMHCTDDVHRVTLGGAEPYNLGINKPAEFTTVTTPIAVDRVVLAACARRVDEDFAGSPLIFDLPLTGGALADPGGDEVADAIDRIYTGGLLRHADDTEVTHLRELYDDIEATGTGAPARDWAVAACFATLSTMEFLFY